jgi:transposase InsO family protein
MFPYRINSKGKIKPSRKETKTRKPKGFKSEPMSAWAVDTIRLVQDGIRRYIMSVTDLRTRIAFAVAMPSKSAKHTAKVLEALITGATTEGQEIKRIAILSDNGSEFMKEFDETLRKRNLTHYWTYPRTPKMNARVERFNRTIQERFAYYNEDPLFTDIGEFNRRMADWLIEYNAVIPHRGLGMKTPVEYLLESHPERQRLWGDTRA